MRCTYTVDWGRWERERERGWCRGVKRVEKRGGVLRVLGLGYEGLHSFLDFGVRILEIYGA